MLNAELVFLPWVELDLLLSNYKVSLVNYSWGVTSQVEDNEKLKLKKMIDSVGQFDWMDFFGLRRLTVKTFKETIYAMEYENTSAAGAAAGAGVELCNRAMLTTHL